MKVIGLTGGIASGKSTLAERMRQKELHVLDADRLVHALLEGAARAEIAMAFPSAVKDGIIDRKALGAQVFADDEKLATLEAILHPRVRAMEEAFIVEERARGAAACVLEIPLLFETGADTLCDVVITAEAPLAQRIARAMQRPNMTEAKIEAILAKQWTDEQRAARADAVIDTGHTLDQTYAQLDAMLEKWVVTR